MSWHRQCYSEFTNEGHIQRLQKRNYESSSEQKVPHLSASRRSSMERMDWRKCMFCHTELKKIPLNQIQTFETSAKILRKADLDRELRCRFAGISDLILMI